MNAAPQRIGILGPGRLGRSLERLLTDSGAQIVLLGRGAAAAGETEGLDLIVLTVPDGAIATVAREVPAGPVVLHCSGATDLSPLAGHRAVGSMHPLMTFPGPERGLPDLRDVPAAVDGDAAGLAHAEWLANALGMRAFRVSGDRRLYHAAAVLAGNGATILLGEACRALVAAGVPAADAAGLLQPLVRRSIDNAVPDPAAALTGPVARGDVEVLAGHDAALRQAGLSELADLHRSLAALAAAWGRNDGWQEGERSPPPTSTKDDSTR